MLSEYTLHHGDCLDVMRTLPDASVDAVITDPPYGTTACKWDGVIPFAPMWEQIQRLLKPRGACVLFGSQPFTSALVMSNPGWFRCEWIWEKDQGTGYLNANRQPMKAHENIIVFSAGEHNYYPQKVRGIPYIATSGDVGGFVRDKTVGGFVTANNGERYPKSVVRFKSDSGLHPTQKPLALLGYLVRTYTKTGDTVLDFTMGSGTTGHACINLDRRFIGIEREAEYFAIAQARLDHAAAQGRLDLETQNAE